MSKQKTTTESGYSLFAWLLFGALFIYLLLRAYFVEPIHDEVATFFHYIETGIYWGDKALLDANNHLLNSYLSHKLFLWFGPEFFFLRLPNVLSFALFFWSIIQLVKPIKNILQRSVVLIALAGIPFILEYFAYTRGYGISLAFFLAAIVFLKRFSDSFSRAHLLMAYLLLTIAVYANLTYLVSCILAIGFVFIVQLLNFKERNWVKQFTIFLFHGLLLYAILPAIHFAEELREGGALYYGSLEGFWEVTGKTLTDYTLFLSGSWFKWVLLGLGIASFFLLIFLWVKNKSTLFFKKDETLIAWFLYGHIAAILFLAYFRDVNYPEDRVAMYLIPLSILLVAYLLNNWKKSSSGIYIFIIFPILFLPRINLNTSVFSPQDRISNAFFDEVSKEIIPNTSLSVYPLMRIPWALQSRKLKVKNTASIHKLFNTAADIVLTRDVLNHKKSDLGQYKLFAHDDKSGFLAYKRIQPFAKTIIFDSTININATENEFISFGNFVIPDSLRRKKLQIHVEANTSTSSKVSQASMVYSTVDKNFNPIVYEGWGLRWSNGLSQNYFLNYNYPIDFFEPKEHEVRIYLWNMNKETISIKNGKFEIISLE